MTELNPRSLRVEVLTSAAFGGRSHHDVAIAALDGGATVVQLRAPELPDDQLVALASDLARRCAERGVLFVVNDRPDVAVASGAAGAHVGQHDGPHGARTTLGPDRVLGVSVASVEDARTALEHGADYVGVTVWETATKPGAVPGGLQLVSDVVRAIPLPVVGIGGIDAGNAARVIEAGAAGVAVISAFAAAPDPVAATRDLVRAVGADRESIARRTT
jgi:thiamine-phosphate pyrophosphorylase